ncbi:MAG: hypothetical protein HYS27_08040 [Deltaproteobacteria bacterium]|nr:hypothetical protein [Deltaproteobacteria bacterium]
MQAFDPRPIRAAALQALLFLAGPGSLEGAQLLAVRAGVAPLVPLVPASTHAMLQLLGGFLTLIFAFLAHGETHLLGLERDKTARARFAIHGVGVLLALDLVGELLGARALVIAARALLVVDVLAFLALLVAARAPRASDRWRAPIPILVTSLACVPLGAALWTWEALGGPSGLAADLLLYAAVVPVVLSMAFQMFGSLLQLPAPNDALFFVALVCWLGGAALRVLGRGLPEAVGLHAPFLVAGALLWLVAMRGLRRRADARAPAVTPSSDLKASAAVAIVCLAVGGALGAWPRLGGPALADDLARHLVAIGFALVVTMAVTLRVLPRICRGRTSSPALGLVALGAVVTALGLRAAELVGAPASATALSGVLSWLAVVLWALHLGRGLLLAVPDRDGGAEGGRATG